MVTALLKNLENLGLAIGKAQFASYLGNVGHTSAVSPNIGNLQYLYCCEIL